MRVKSAVQYVLICLLLAIEVPYRALRHGVLLRGEDGPNEKVTKHTNAWQTVAREVMRPPGSPHEPVLLLSYPTISQVDNVPRNAVVQQLLCVKQTTVGPAKTAADAKAASRAGTPGKGEYLASGQDPGGVNHPDRTSRPLTASVHEPYQYLRAVARCKAKTHIRGAATP